MSLTSYEIVRGINSALSQAVINIATDPSRQANYLSEFASRANELLAQRNVGDISDHRCSNCGHQLFEPSEES